MLDLMYIIFCNLLVNRCLMNQRLDLLLIFLKVSRNVNNCLCDCVQVCDCVRLPRSLRVNLSWVRFQKAFINFFIFLIFYICFQQKIRSEWEAKEQVEKDEREKKQVRLLQVFVCKDCNI